MKKILSVLSLLLIANLTSCGILGESQSKVEPRCNLVVDNTSSTDTADIIIDALNRNDSDLMKSVFSEQALELSTDIDDGIDYIFSIYEGEYLETVYQGQSIQSFSGGKITGNWAICVIKTTEKFYSLRWTEWSQQEIDPYAKGVYSFEMKECEESQQGAGGGCLLAGILYPKKNMDENVVSTLMASLYNNDREKLKSILSDDFLSNSDALVNIDEFIETYTPQYHNLTAAWKVNNTIFVQLRSYNAYICLHLSKKQSEKISSIRIFDSTIENIESVSKFNFDSDNAGIYMIS